MPNKYTCKEFPQEKYDTISYTMSPPGCSPPITCPSPTTTTRPRVPPLKGQKTPDCAPAPDGIAACPCEPGDTRTCCSIPGCPPSTTSTTWSGLDIHDNSLDLSNKWDCHGTAEKGTTTTTNQPPPPACSDVSSGTARVVCGDKSVTCVNACTDKGTMVWGRCEEISAGNCKLQGEMELSCNSPCAATSPGCNSLDISTCPSTRPLSLSERISCPCPKLCVGGEFDGMAEPNAKTACIAKGLDWNFTATDMGTFVDCECIFNPSGVCYDGNGNAVTPEHINDCNDLSNNPRTEWHDHPVCACLGDKNYGGTHSVRIEPSCFLPRFDQYAGTENPVKTLLTDAGFTTTTSGGNTTFTSINSAVHFGNLFGRITCGDFDWDGQGASSHANYAAVQTMRGLADKSVHGNCTSNTGLRVTWSC